MISGLLIPLNPNQILGGTVNLEYFFSPIVITLKASSFWNKTQT